MGVEETFSITVETSDQLAKNGITTGRIILSGTDSSTDNIISAYLIFGKKYSGKLTAKAIDENGLEFGRSSLTISADSGDARFADFAFDKCTNLDRKDHVRVE